MSTPESILLFIYFYLFILATSPVGSLFLDQRLNKFPLQWKSRTLTTGAPGKSQEILFKSSPAIPRCMPPFNTSWPWGKMKVSIVCNLPALMWVVSLVYYQATQISDMMESPGGTSGAGRFCILSLVLRAFIDLSNHILLFPTTNSQSENDTW